MLNSSIYQVGPYLWLDEYPVLVVSIMGLFHLGDNFLVIGLQPCKWSVLQVGLSYHTNLKAIV